MISKNKITIAVAVLFVTLGLIVNFKTIKSRKVAGVESSTTFNSAKVLVVPHHLLAKDLIVEAYDTIPKDSFEYVVLLGPNHYFPKSESITAAESLAGVNIDTKMIYKVLDRLDNVTINEDQVKADHSIMVQIPYIASHFPSAKILPFLISPYYNSTKIDEFVNFLVDNLPARSLIIASVDFSHNTQELEALDRNKETISALEKFDYEKLQSFTDLNTDSPLSLIIAGKLAQRYGASQWQTLQSSHASQLENDVTIQGTSYVTGVYSFPEEE